MAGFTSGEAFSLQNETRFGISGLGCSLSLVRSHADFPTLRARNNNRIPCRMGHKLLLNVIPAQA